MISDARAAVLAEALTWRGTPFHDNAEVRGGGVDCAHFCHAVFRGAGVIPDMGIERYSPQHMLHRDQELFLGYVLRTGAREIKVEALKPADLVLYKIGRVFAHGAIVIDWPRQIIHAHKQSRFVVITGGRDCGLGKMAMRAFTFWDS